MVKKVLYTEGSLFLISNFKFQFFTLKFEIWNLESPTIFGFLKTFLLPIKTSQ
jgi:hypothetical protein